MYLWGNTPDSSKMSSHELRYVIGLFYFNATLPPGLKVLWKEIDTNVRFVFVIASSKEKKIIKLSNNTVRIYCAFYRVTVFYSKIL